MLQAKNFSMQEEISKLKNTLSGGRYSVGLATGDPSPSDQLQRASYVASVAGVYKDILEPKLRQMIARSQELISNTENTREEDLAIKGMIFGYWELLRWGSMMVSEHLSNINDHLLEELEK